MRKKQVNIRLESELIDRYENLAMEHDRDRTYFMVKALEAFVVEALCKPKKELKTTKPKFDPIEYGQDFHKLHQEGWQAWVDKRREMKKPISQSAAKTQVSMLIKYQAEEQRRIIWESIKNDYQGLFEPKQIKPPITGKSTTRDMTLEQELSDTSWARGEI